MGITNSQFDAIMRVYEKRRIDNHHVEEEHRRIAYEAIPALRELDKAVASLSVEAVRQSLTGRGSASGKGIASGLGERLVRAAGGMPPEKRRRQLLRAHSFPEGYLDPVYTCPDCRDTGWIGQKHCHCFEREVVSLFYTQSGLADVLARENFETFDLSLYPEDLIDEKTGKSSREIMAFALQTCQSFAKNYGSGRQMDNLLLSGAVGLGKTFLTHCIAKELIDKGHSVIYYSAGALFDRLADYRFKRTEEDGEDAFNDAYLTGCDLLIIDDLGTEFTNSFVGSALFQLLNTRISLRRGTVISTNLSPLEIGRTYSDRISSRIMEHFILIQAFGADIRIRKRLGIMAGMESTGTV
ncbi:MAG TPA: DNA replication protein DnaC [Lachnospiraceae bacterium]|nr:DNA replication protein DnaC [Lachnospiraceae bacterium]